MIAVTVVALVAGSHGNTDSGTPLELGVSIGGINATSAATAAITGGADLETDGPLRTRMQKSYAAPPRGGNQADLVTWAVAKPGALDCWPLKAAGQVADATCGM